MAETITGGCNCGAIRYTAEGRILYMGNCHCRDCQQATGTAYFAGLMVKETDFTLEKGGAAWFDKAADAGHNMRRGFCRDCGSPLFMLNGRNDAVRLLYAASLDNPSIYKPDRDIYTTSAQPWDHMNPALDKYEAMPF